MALAPAPLADAAVDPGVEEDEEGEGEEAQDDEAAPVVVARVDVVHAHGRDGDERANLKESDKDQGHAPTHSGAGAGVPGMPNKLHCSVTVSRMTTQCTVPLVARGMNDPLFIQDWSNSAIGFGVLLQFLRENVFEGPI